MPFQQLVGEVTGHVVPVFQRVDQAGYRLPLDERVLSDADTLLMKGLGVPVENRYGLRPGVVPGTTKIAPLTANRDLDKRGWGFRDGISHPAIEGSGIPGTNPHEQPLKAGEFVLGYRDETGGTQKTEPEVLWRNGTYVVFRKLHQRVAAFRKYLHATADASADEELLAAKMMGRWRSGAPLAHCPAHDDPTLGADPERNNDFLYEADDPAGLKTPAGSHIRRCNPRDASIAGVARIHRMIRRGTAYGPVLPEGVLDDDGASQAPPQAAPRYSAICRHTRRRVLLHARAARIALAE